MAGSKVLHTKIHAGPKAPAVQPVRYAVSIIGVVEAPSVMEGKRMVFDAVKDVASSIPGATDAYVSLRRSGTKPQYIPSSVVSTQRAKKGEQWTTTHKGKPSKIVKARSARRKVAKSNLAAAHNADQERAKWQWADMHDVDRRFHNNLMNLTKEERAVLAHRYGLNGVQAMKPETVKNMFNISDYAYGRHLASGLLKLGLKGYKKGIKVIPGTEINSASA